MEKLSEQMGKFLRALGHAIMAVLAVIASGQGVSSNLKPAEPDEQVVTTRVSLLDGNSALPPDDVSGNRGIDEIKQAAAENLIDGLDAVAEEKRKQLDKKILEQEQKRQEAENNYADVRSIYDIPKPSTPPQKPEND